MEQRSPNQATEELRGKKRRSVKVLAIQPKIQPASHLERESVSQRVRDTISQ